MPANLLRFSSLPSSNDWLLEKGRELSPGTLVWAEKQTAGRGRAGRSWQSDAGSLCFSILLPPAFPIHQLHLYNLAAPLALQETLRGLGYGTHLKFPNDLIAEGGKVAGVLVESSFSGRELEFVVAGFGVNWQSVPTALREPRLPPRALQDLPRQELSSQVSSLPDALELMLAVRESLLTRLGRAEDVESLIRDYNGALGEFPGAFRTEDGEIHRGQVRGYDARGRILLQTSRCMEALDEGAEWLDEAHLS